jgi:hypothetical protein
LRLNPRGHFHLQETERHDAHIYQQRRIGVSSTKTESRGA